MHYAPFKIISLHLVHCGLLLLILNDHWLKYAYNAITGKLSDFAGVSVLAIFLTACLRGQKMAGIVIVLFIANYRYATLINWSNSILPDYGTTGLLITPTCIDHAYTRIQTSAFQLPIAGNKMDKNYSLYHHHCSNLCYLRAIQSADYAFPDGCMPIGETCKHGSPRIEILYKLDGMQIGYYG